MTAVELPDVLRLPRDQWAEHPHYPSQVLLMGSHEHFRHTSRSLVERARKGGDMAAIGWVFAAWKSAMAGHEHYEEGKLYPYLEARWGLSCDALRAGHHTLSELEAGVHAAIEREDREALHATLGAHHDALMEHLEIEETFVIPALLALSPDEFRRYANSGIRSLLADLHERG